MTTNPEDITHRSLSKDKERETNEIEVPIAGVLKRIQIRDIPIDDILLDEDNPRVGYARDDLSSYSDTTSQDDLAYWLRMQYPDDYNRLKRSIEAGGGATEMIWVMKQDQKYLCLDGNTRIMIYRELRDKYPKKETYQKIKARILPNDIDERDKNFIRLIAHLRGENDWAAYERARMLYLLWYRQGYTEEELQNTTKLPLNDIRRWREAYKIMNEQFLPKYGTKSRAILKFSYFVEYVSKKIKDGMKKHGLEDKDFSDWVGNGEITRAQDVRDLKRIFENEKIAETLKEEGFQAAKEELSLSVPEYGSRLFEHIEKCIVGLKSMSREEEGSIIRDEEPKKKEKIKELYKELSNFIDVMDKYEGTS